MGFYLSGMDLGLNSSSEQLLSRRACDFFLNASAGTGNDLEKDLLFVWLDLGLVMKRSWHSSVGMEMRSWVKLM